MKLDFTKIDITNEEDWVELKQDWKDYYNGEYTFEKYRGLLSKLNVIVGFGRGFWGGGHGYSYLVFHRETEKYYWYLRDIESDENVYFYEIEETAPIFQLLDTKAIAGNFDEFDEALDYSTLHALSVGNTTNMPTGFKPVALTELFGADTSPLRMALMMFYPASQGTKYPHKEFHKKFFAPKFQLLLDVKVQTYNRGTFEVFKKGNSLFVDLGGDVFRLEKI